MKFFTRRQQRSIHKGQQERALRRALRESPESGPVRQSVIQALCPNLDRLVIVSSLHLPPLKPGLVDRLLALAESERLPAVLVFTKLDLCSDSEQAQRYQRLYQGLGYPSLLCSSLDGRGLETLAGLLAQGRSALSGHSGVGKSSLLRALQQNYGWAESEAPAEVGEVSQATRRGRHTTTRVRLLRLNEQAEIFDLPGLKEAGLQLEPAELSRAFVEFGVCRCRYRDCLHREEPDCAVRRGVEEGLIEASRYRSYLSLLSG